MLSWETKPPKPKEAAQSAHSFPALPAGPQHDEQQVWNSPLERSECFSKTGELSSVAAARLHLKTADGGDHT